MDCANLKTLFIIVVCVKARVCVCICIWMPRCMWRGQKATLLGCGLYLSLWYSPSTMWVLRNSGHQAWSHLLHHPAAPQIMPCLLCIIFLIHNNNSMVCILFYGFCELNESDTKEYHALSPSLDRRRMNLKLCLHFKQNNNSGSWAS